ncbi:MAG: hypothetical protein MUO82_07470 [Candidatus Thermoplasmatota archaeon]|nr:hypothetical protein [Candidatus Thermoplasmatota archaeon]
MISVALLTASITYLPVALAETCDDCSEIREALSQEEMELLWDTIENSSEIKQALENISSNINDLDFNNLTILDVEMENYTKSLVTIHVQGLTKYTVLGIFLNNSIVNDIVIIKITNITGGVLASFKFDNGNSVDYAQSTGDLGSQEVGGGVILNLQVLDSEFNEEFWICFINCLLGITLNQICVIAGWECIKYDNPKACYVWSACTFGAAIGCAWACSGLGSEAEASGSIFMTSTNDCIITEESINRINIYNQNTSELIISGG